MAIDKTSFDLFSKTEPIKTANETPRYIAPAEEVVSIPVFQKPEIKGPAATQAIKKNKIESGSRFDQLLPVTLRVSEDDYMDLKQIENSIMRGRSKNASSDRERITVNSILRCLVSNFIERVDLVDLGDIENEYVLNSRIQKIFKNKPADQ